MPEKMAPSSRCGACKILRRKCKQECAFAPYFPSHDSDKFLMVHNVFGASNVAKLLERLPAQDRKDAVSSLVYEAISRLVNPVYGCVRYIHELEQQLRHMKNPRQELSAYIEPAAFSALPHPHNSGGGGGGEVGCGTPFGIPTTLVAWPQTQMLLQQNQQQALQNQHIAAAISNYEQQEISKSRFSMDGGGGGAGSSVMTMVDGRYNPMSMMGWMPSSSNNPFGAQPEESDHQNPQVSPAAVGALSVHHHQLSLQPQPQLYLQQPLGQVSPAAAGTSSEILQQQQHLYLQQPQGQMSPAAAGASSVQQEMLQQQPQLYLQQQLGQMSPAAAWVSSEILQQQQQLYLQHPQGQVSPAAAGASSVHHRYLSLQQEILLQQQQLHLQQQEGQEPALHLRDAGDDIHSAGPSC